MPVPIPRARPGRRPRTDTSFWPYELRRSTDSLRDPNPNHSRGRPPGRRTQANTGARSRTLEVLSCLSQYCCLRRPPAGVLRSAPCARSYCSPARGWRTRTRQTRPPRQTRPTRRSRSIGAQLPGRSGLHRGIRWSPGVRRPCDRALRSGSSGAQSRSATAGIRSRPRSGPSVSRTDLFRPGRPVHGERGHQRGRRHDDGRFPAHSGAGSRPPPRALSGDPFPGRRRRVRRRLVPMAGRSLRICSALDGAAGDRRSNRTVPWSTPAVSHAGCTLSPSRRCSPMPRAVRRRPSTHR